MEISFTSKLTALKSAEFSKRTSSFNRDNFVDFPWTISSSRIAKDVYTNNICDCTACLITDGEKALLKHLIPIEEDNHDFFKVEKFVSDNIDLYNSNLQAVLIGSNPATISKDIFKKFLIFLNKFHIPTTVLEEGKKATHIAYRTCTDEVLISNKKIDELLSRGANNSQAIYGGFENVKIADCDCL